MTRNRVYDQEDRAGQPTFGATTRDKCLRSTRRLRSDFSIAIDFEECHGSQPNFYFHAATTYDILRWKGVRIGKRAFTGRLRTKPIAARA
jgi:hypothetical protein